MENFSDHPAPPPEAPEAPHTLTPLHPYTLTPHTPTPLHPYTLTSHTLAPRTLTIDVEEYFHIEAARATVKPADWPSLPSRVEGQMDHLLEILAEHRVQATLFVLGWVAQQRPELVKRWHAAGHEIASHGMTHQRLTRLPPEEQLAELCDSRKLLEDLTGDAVLGFRAPTWSVTRQNLDSLARIAEAGYRYDASIFPVRHPQYGVPDAPITPYAVGGAAAAARAGSEHEASASVSHALSEHEASASVSCDALRRQRPDGTLADAACSDGEPAGDADSATLDPRTSNLLEIPPLVWRVLGRNLPAAGGGYFRHLPLTLMKRAMRQARKQRRATVLYFHPWEFDADLPRLPLPFVQRLRTYAGLRRSTARLHELLRCFPDGWTPMRSLLSAH